LPLVEAWLRAVLADPTGTWDQGEFNRLARYQWDPRSTKGLSDPRLFWSYKKQLIGGVLPLALFAGGHNHFVSQLARRRGEAPYSIHTTYQYGGAAGKRHRLREAMVWIDKPAYYDPPGGLLSFSPHVPAALVHPPGGMDTRGHIALIQHQLKQLLSALAVAHTLGRILIMPSVTCGYDKAWYPLSSGQPRNNFASKGVFPGAHAFILPIYDCPIDHYLEVGMLTPISTIREYSFLANPRTPAAVRAATANVTLRKGSAAAGEIDRLRSTYPPARAKVLHVTNIPDIDARAELLTTRQAMALRSKFGFVGGSWCCAPHADSKKGQPQSAHFSLMGGVGRFG